MNVDKLPKWAQWKIGKLESDLNSAKDELAAFRGQESAIVVSPDAGLIDDRNVPKYLPDRTTIQYKVNYGEIEIDLRDGVLKVLAMGDGDLVVQPHSSNYVIVRLIKEAL